MLPHQWWNRILPKSLLLHLQKAESQMTKYSKWEVLSEPSRNLVAHKLKKSHWWKFPGGPVVRILGFHCCGPGSAPGPGTEIWQALWCEQKRKRKVTGIMWLPKNLKGNLILIWCTRNTGSKQKEPSTHLLIRTGEACPSQSTLF